MHRAQALARTIPADVLGIVTRLRERGKRAWIVGGSVRDMLRGVPVADYDVCTDARPEEVMRAFSRVIPTGIEHGTVSVLVRGRPYEVTTLRGEGSYTDGRRPDAVRFLDDIREDLARRDFTVNAIALDPVDGVLVDPFGGEADLERRVIRAVGDPLARFSEDGLRVLRAARFAATLEAGIDEPTRRAIPACLSTYAKVSPERVRDEWMKTMKARQPSRAFDVMRETGILSVTCPELEEGVGMAQNRFHAFDVWRHTMACLDACPREPVLRVAGLLHDVGKPRTRALSDKTGDFTFYGHERVGAEIAHDILTRLRFSNDERARITSLVRHHLVCYDPSWTDAAVRRWIRRVGEAHMEPLYDLARADALAKGLPADEELRRIAELDGRVRQVLAAGDALSVRALRVNGHDLMTELGLSRGRVIGETLERLLELVLDDPSQNERGALLDAARRLIEPPRGG